MSTAFEIKNEHYRIIFLKKTIIIKQREYYKIINETMACN